MLKPSLIPRFNIEYKYSDLVYGILSAIKNNGYDLNLLKEIFGKVNIFFTNSGRTSLYVILRSLNLPKGSKIGVPLYSCTVVFDAIIKAGYTPYFLDIDLDNYTLDPQYLKEHIGNIDAVVVIHTFGRPADMDEIKKVAKGIPIIEDCAHSLFSEYKGKKTGALGDASFFSLAKYISAGEGGMIIANDGKLANKVQKEVNSLSNTTMMNDLRKSFTEYAKSFFYRKPWFGLFAFSLGSVLESKVDLMNKKSFNTSKINKINFNIFIKKMKILKTNVEIQRKNSFFLLNELKDTSLILPYEKRETYCNYYLFPIRFHSKYERDRAWKILRRMNVDSAKLYSMTPNIAKRVYRYTGNCPNAELLADTVLTIPNYYTLTNDELLKIAKVVKEAS